MARTAQAAVCDEGAGKAERWVVAGTAYTLQLSKDLKLLNEMVGKEEALVPQ